MIIPLVVAGSVLGAAVGFAAEHSALWGERGEKWNPRSRLPDFSFAGYHRGEQVLPNVPPGVSVKDFGAKENLDEKEEEEDAKENFGRKRGSVSCQ